MTRPWNIVMAWVREHFYDGVMDHCDGKGMEHCDETAMEQSDDICHAAL